MVVLLVVVCDNDEFNNERRVQRYQSESESVYRRTDNTMIKRTNNDLKTYTKTKDRVTRTPLNTGDGLRCSGRVSSSFSASGTRRVNQVTNPVTSHE